MGNCAGDGQQTSPCGQRDAGCSEQATDDLAGALQWFSRMIPNCLAYAKEAKAQGKPIVGIMCEFTPRELIMAAGAVPMCLCGGSNKTIAPAEQHLPANLCPLIKSTYGYHLTRGNPFLEMADLIVAETTCDGKKKMYELMGETRPMYILELPHKSDRSEALAYWHDQLVQFKVHLEKRFEARITPQSLRQAIALMNRERRLRRELAGLMRSDNPPLTGRQLLELKSSISGIEADLLQYERAVRACASSTGDARQRSPVRVLMTGVPMAHGAERVLELVENMGGLVVCQESCTGLKPILDDVDELAADPLAALAEKYYHLPCSVMTHNCRRLDILRQLVAEYRPHCIIELIWQACLTYDVESFKVRRLAQEELGLPYLRIETDYSPSDSARIMTRVQALFETVKQRCGG
jgi:benzoyl-CoA reductase/2-hydroxyglutaryl-CoA dehydratase subunit BcrC/BadD/HgdB